MKKIIAGILVMILAVGCFAGCATQQADGDISPEKDSPLIGCWVYEDGGNKFAMQFFTNGMVVTATTRNNGTSWYKECYSYFVENDFLCMYESDDSAPKTAKISIDGNELTITSVSTPSDNYHSSNSEKQTCIKQEHSIEDYLLNHMVAVEEATPTTTPVPTVTRAPSATTIAPEGTVPTEGTVPPQPIAPDATVAPAPVATLGPSFW